MLSLSLGVAAPARSCAEEPCGAGTCQETEGHVICLCPPGSTGERCDIGKTLKRWGMQTGEGGAAGRRNEQGQQGSGSSDWEEEVCGSKPQAKHGTSF